MKKKILSLLCVALIACSIFSINASANQYVYVTGDLLNIRSGPSTSYDIVGQVSFGSALTVYGMADTWYYIEYNGIDGFVSGDYVSSNKPAPAPQANTTYQPAPVSTTGERVCEYAKNFIGIPYVYGGNSPSQGFDCSGFVKYVFANFGVNLPRTSYSQMNVGTPVTRDQLVPGDLVVFRGGGHVGIYVGNNKYIHAPQTGRTISIDDMNRELYCARRLVY